MWIPCGHDQWIDDRDPETPKIWLENLTEAEYEAYRVARALAKQEREVR